MNRRHLGGAILVAAVLAGGCAGADDDASERTQSDSSSPDVSTREGAAPSTPVSTSSVVTTLPPTTTVPAASTATTSPDDAPATVSTSEPIEDEFRFVESVIEVPPSDEGWILPAGTWHISSFEPTLRIETSQGLVVVEQSQGAIELAVPGSVRSTALTVLVPTSVASDGDQRNAPGGIDFEQFLEASEWAEIEAMGTVPSESGRTVRYADIRITPPTSEELPACRLGPACVWTMETLNADRVQARPGALVRLVTLGDQSPVRVVATANDPAEFDRLADEALGVARSIVTAPDAEAPTETPSFLSMVSTRLDRVPAGHHAMSLGDVEVHVELDDPLEGFAVDFVDRDSLVIAAGDIGIGLVRPRGFVDPDTPQVNAPPDPNQLLADPPERVAEYEAWLDAFRVIDSRRETTLGGLPAYYWEAPSDPEAPSYECGGPMQDGAWSDERCRTLYLSDLGWWWTRADDDPFDPDASYGRGYFVDGTGILVNLFSSDPMPIEEIEAIAAPILDALTFVVHDES